MESLCMYIYEVKKGSKPLALVTLDSKDESRAIEKINKFGLCYTVQKCGEKKINLFFGAKIFVDTVNTLIEKPLNKLDPTEDFILGIVLGYDREIQCQRYLKNCHNG